MKEDEIDFKTFLPLAKYLVILVDSYPHPIRANVLAEKTGHSKAAISKIRDRLLQVCDRNHMVFEKGFVLSSSFNFLPSIFIVLLVNGQHRLFLSSPFFKALISSKRIHDKISLAFPVYGSRFDEEDTGFLIQKLVQSIERLPPKDFKFLLKLFTSKKPSTYIELLAGENTKKITRRLQFTFDNENELIKTIFLRDKFFFLIRDIIWAKIEEMEILKTLDNKSRENYKNVYKKTVDFYLRKIFEDNNESLLKAGNKYFKKDAKKKIQIGVSHFMTT